ncbi:hypothetical protein Pmani_010301 [Petrolisthes manimaculis]|uniref:Lysosome-associated membrane glycoprotein 2-like transmembrane domain-containing protein n=1 Tax=Petrolisthes manimaculis TaxID=1843537 RepID=A0AAE1Q1V7_9EUCA|nr:hypothetical protein Pmani_010301 [Petrolisthes manimaculis]
MARFTVFLLSCLLISGAVVMGQNSADTKTPDTTDPTTSDTTTPTTTSTTTSTTTTPTTTSTTTSTTTTPTTTTSTTTTTTTTSTAPTTTETPDTTTTETPDTTTTETPDTTTETPDTTTDTPTTSTTEVPTTSAPDKNIKYNVTDKYVTCVMIDGSISFSVNYTLVNNETKVVTVEVPTYGGDVNGSCSDDGTQWIEVSWGTVGTSNIRLSFEKSSDNSTWSLKDSTASLYMDSKTFVNASKKVAGKNLDLIMYFELNPSDVPVNHSYNCIASLSTKNVSATIDGTEYKQPVTSAMSKTQMQAYNGIPNEPDFVANIHCDADATSDIVPIAVGCALAGLVVIVLIAYLVGRRRRSGAYQSV